MNLIQTMLNDPMCFQLDFQNQKLIVSLKEIVFFTNLDKNGFREMYSTLGFKEPWIKNGLHVPIVAHEKHYMTENT